MSMTLGDFNLAELLTFKPEEGRLMLEDDRMLLFRQEAFAFLRTLLIEQLGTHFTHAILSQFGYRCGYGDYAVLSTAFDWASENDQLGCGPVMHSWEGLVLVEPLEMSFDRDKGHFFFRGLWKNSYEAELHLDRFGLSKEPVCSSLTGYASGWCTAFFGREVLAIEDRCVGKGDEHCEWRIRPLEEWGDEARRWKDAHGATNLTIARDLERKVEKRTEELRHVLAELERKNEALTELDRMKSQFLANMSHEFRTPLTLILGPLNSILADKATQVSADVKKDLDRISRNGARLYRLVNEMLDFSKLEAGQMTLHCEPVDIGELAQSIVGDAAAQAEANGQTLTFHCDAELLVQRTDRGMIDKILINLIGNALKFTPRGGRIDVFTRSTPTHLELIVADTGPGIAAEDRERIFERFRQADASSTRKHEGTGLGLALVREFSRLHGGEVLLDSTPGEGACFTVRLPRRDAADGNHPAGDDPRDRLVPRFDMVPPEPDRTDGREPVSGSADRPTVLIADDNREMRSFIREILERVFLVREVENGLQAWQAMKEDPPDMLVSDIMMPEVDGIELVRKVKADPELKLTPCILVTARAGAEASVSGLDSGADDYLVKPFSPEELVARLSSAWRLCVAHRELRNKQAQLVDLSREAGKAELAAGVIHNICNVLQNVKVTVEAAQETLDVSKPRRLARAISMLNEHGSDLAAFLTEDKRGKVLPQYLEKSIASLREVFTDVDKLLQDISFGVEQIDSVVQAQQEYAKTVVVRQPVAVEELIRGAIRLQGRHGAEIGVELDGISGQTFSLDRHRTTQILVNLLKNAVAATEELDSETRSISVHTRLTGDGKLRIVVSDNGAGIEPENINKIFAHGYTTRVEGRGFGLHVSALSAREMAGALWAESEGPGRGSRFILEIPVGATTSAAVAASD